MSLLAAAAAAVSVRVTVGQSGVAWPLKLNAGKYLEDQNNVPFQLAVDAGWELTTQISDADVITYLDDRLAQGFNAVEIRIIGRAYQSNAPNDFYGNAPFSDLQDWSTRNTTYWERMDAIIAAMKSRNMVAVVFPAYLGAECSSDAGWCEDMAAASNTTAILTAYGDWIGDRYSVANGYGNVIWMTGGDVDADDYGMQIKNDAVVSGVRSGFSGALFGAEPAPFQIAGIDSYTTSSLDFNCVYSYGSVATEVERAYNNGVPRGSV